MNTETFSTAIVSIPIAICPVRHSHAGVTLLQLFLLTPQTCLSSLKGRQEHRIHKRSNIELTLTTGTLLATLSCGALAPTTFLSHA
jgi:hypothetical protein